MCPMQRQILQFSYFCNFTPFILYFFSLCRSILFLISSSLKIISQSNSKKGKIVHNGEMEQKTRMKIEWMGRQSISQTNKNCHLNTGIHTRVMQKNKFLGHKCVQISFAVGDWYAKWVDNVAIFLADFPPQGGGLNKSFNLPNLILLGQFGSFWASLAFYCGYKCNCFWRHLVRVFGIFFARIHRGSSLLYVIFWFWFLNM